MQNYNHKVGKKFSVHKIIHPKAARRSSYGTLKRCFSSLVHSKQLSVHNKVNNLPFFPTFNSRRRSEVQPKKDGVMVRKYFFFETNYAGVPLKYAWFHSNHFFFQRHFLGDVRFKIYQNRSHFRVGRVPSIKHIPNFGETLICLIFNFQYGFTCVLLAKKSDLRPSYA